MGNRGIVGTDRTSEIGAASTAGGTDLTFEIHVEMKQRMRRPGRPRPAEIDGRRPTVTPENGKAQVAEEAALGLASPEGPRAWLGTLRTGVNRRGPA